MGSKIQDLIQILTPCLSFKISQFKTGIRLQASYARKLNYEKSLKSVQTNKICKKWKILPKYTHQAREIKPRIRKDRRASIEIRERRIEIPFGQKFTKTNPKTSLRRYNLRNKSGNGIAKLRKREKVNRRAPSPLLPIEAAKRRMKKTLKIARLDGLNHLLSPKVEAKVKNNKHTAKRRQRARLL